MQTLAAVINHILQQCSKALRGEPFSITIPSGSLLPVVDVNGVLLVAAAPLQAFLTYTATPPAQRRFTLPQGNLHCNTGPPWLTLAIPQLETRGNPRAMKMNNYVFPLCCYPQWLLQLSISKQP